MRTPNAFIVPKVRICTVDSLTKPQRRSFQRNGNEALTGSMSNTCEPCDSCFGAEHCLYNVTKPTVDLLEQLSTRDDPTFVACRVSDDEFAGCAHVTTMSHGGKLESFTHTCPKGARVVSTLCVPSKYRKDNIGGIIVNHIVRRYSGSCPIYLTVRPKRGQLANRNFCPARAELDGRVDKLLHFYHKRGFRIVEKTPDLWLLKFSPS